VSQTQITTPAAAAQSARQSRWTASRIATLAVGVLLVLVSLALIGGGGTGLWADLTQRDGGYVTSGDHTFSTAGSALATEPTRLGSSGVGWLYGPGVLGNVRIRVTPRNAGTAMFVGIAPTAAADRYLAGVDHTVVTDFFKDRLETVSGGAARTAPGRQHIWVATASGPGTQTLLWKPSNGSWTVVVMNADGTRGIDVSASLGARMSAVRWIAVGLLAAGALFLTAGALLLVVAIRRRPNTATN